MNQSTNAKRALGDLGEAYAAAYLQERGFAVLERNWHCRSGEIDIIAADAEYLLFVEVKTRGAHVHVSPEWDVDLRKQHKLALAEQSYWQQNPLKLQPRFDVILVTHENSKYFTIRQWIPNAFEEG
jgi:putative endonuclease